MCVFLSYMLTGGYGQYPVIFVGKAAGAVLGQRADIGLGFEDIRNRLGRPPGRRAALRIFSVHPCIVRSGIWYSLVRQRSCDRLCRVALEAHIVNSPYDARRLFVDDRRAVFVRACSVAVWIRPVGILTFAPVGLQHGADFFARICRVPLVKHIHDGHHIHAGARAIGGIYVIRKSDKSDAVSGKDIINILPHLNIISSEAGQVFHDDCIDLSVFGVLKKSLYGRAFKVCPRSSVVNVLTNDCASLFFYKPT